MERFLNINSGNNNQKQRQKKRRRKKIRTVEESRRYEEERIQREQRKAALKIQLQKEEIQKMSLILWNSTFELFIHQVLYVRRLYEQDSYCSTRFLNMQCWINRHPDVVKYIDDTVEMITEAIVGTPDDCKQQGGECNSMSIIFFELYTQIRYEKFTLEFANLKKSKKKCKLASTKLELKQQESDARDLILSTLTLDGMASPDFPNSTTFRIELYLPNDFVDPNNSKLCQEYTAGNWFCTDRRHHRKRKKRSNNKKKVGEGNLKNDDDYNTDYDDSDDDDSDSDDDDDATEQEEQQQKPIRYAYRMKYSTGKFHYQLKMNEDEEERKRGEEQQQLVIEEEEEEKEPEIDQEEIERQKQFEEINIRLGLVEPPKPDDDEEDDDYDDTSVDLQGGKFIVEKLEWSNDDDDDNNNQGGEDLELTPDPDLDW